jgi:hypothetical protein
MPIAATIAGRTRDLGGFSVARVLPALQRRQLGPFVFFDEMGPADFAPGTGIDVRPHPHIGLATITWLFDGAIYHRDSLGTSREIRPGAVNWMVAGRGIVHSERTPPAVRAAGHRLHGIQAWVALPVADAECTPAFQHVPADALPDIRDGGAAITLIAGRWGDHAAPVQFGHPIIYAQIRMAAGAWLVLPDDGLERGLYLAGGAATLDGAALPAGAMAVLAPGDAVLAAAEPALVMLAGGAPYPEPRHMEWNFVAHDPARIAAAVADWRAGRFPPVPGDDEHIPY